MSEDEQASSAARVMQILQLMAYSAGPISAGTVVRKLDLPRSTVHRLLRIMEGEGFVTHLPEEHRWGLGIRTFEVGSAYLRQDPLQRLARPLLVQAISAVEKLAPAAIHLGILFGAELMFLLKEQTARPVTVISEVGVRLPAHLTASGRAILAHLPRAQVRALFSNSGLLVQRAATGPKSTIELRSLLASELRIGWSTEDEFIAEGFASVAAPVFDHSTYPIASIGVTFRRDSLKENDWEQMAQIVKRTATALTSRLHGHTPKTPVS